MSRLLDASIHQRFSSRFGLILSALGIAVGTGNIWRFPRIAAQTGGEEGAGAFLIAWLIFLFLWSIPLIIAEYGLGRKHRSGVIGIFIKAMGGKFAWMGGFVAMVATAIAFFYAVVVGWCLYYLVQTVLYPLPQDTETAVQMWDGFQSSGWPFLVHLAAVTFAGLSIGKGVRRIERVNKILIPALLIIVILSVLRAVTLPGAGAGIGYLFRPQWNQLARPEIWLQALTQNAWDTGAGWGLFLTYAAYMKLEHGAVKNAFTTGIGNNMVSILAAVMIFGTVFSILQGHLGMADAQVLEVMRESGPASTGLTFMWMPQLFARMPFGSILAVLFFLGLSFAGFSSLIAMFELASRLLVDTGIQRSRAVLIVVGISYLLGIPSARNLDFLSNQDFVWGLGLMISGAIIACTVIKGGTAAFRSDLNAMKNDWKLGKWWDYIISYFIPIAALILLIWWMFLAITQFAPGEWLNPFNPYSIATIWMQWLILLAGLLLFNNRIVRRMTG
ncbi:MAG: sodium-dependent transporter [Bacteroidales bacterium]